MDRVKDLLLALHKEFPTDGQRHNIVVDPDTGDLMLNVYHCDLWITFRIPPEDYGTSTEQAMAEITGYLDSEDFLRLQLGVQGGDLGVPKRSE